MNDAQSMSQAPVKPGDVLAGKYRVEKILGVGGMGVVVAALHTELDERVALKFLLPSVAQNPGVVARFNREARAAVKIKSQHVARVSDVGTLENGTPYIVMEYLHGKDLGDVLTREGHLPAGVAIDYVLQASEAIAEAHAAGIVHRDLKPANLFLAEQPDGTSIVKVLDFGISKAVIADEPTGGGALTGTSDVFGSPTYMSPEQLKASRNVDARTDIWALGVILYELIGGRAPFERDTVAETFGCILYEQPAPLRTVRPEIPEELDRVISRCLEKDPAKRTPNVAELARGLAPYAASSSHASVERASRILKRAGLMAELPPAADAGAASVQARTNVSPEGAHAPSPGSQTRSAWGTASRVQRPGGARTTLFAGVAAGVLVAGLASVLLFRRLQPAPVVVPMQPEQATARAGATSATETAPAATPGPTAPTAVTPEPTTSVVLMPTVAKTAEPAPSAKGKAGRRDKRAPTAAPAPPPAAAPAPAPPPKPAKPADDDFGDRK
jgi:serine/threonine-protein kinase